jgi:hypothetical protein
MADGGETSDRNAYDDWLQIERSALDVGLMIVVCKRLQALATTHPALAEGLR